jgi:diguanylate cyclase
VLDTALDQATRWRQAGLRLSVAVNLSTRSLLDPTFPDQVAGYSSMAYLKELPVDELKIDRSFVSQMATSPGDAVIVRSTIDLGHNLGLRVVAEGVETQHAWNALADLGCDTAQGYLLGRPVPATELERQLNQPAQPAADVVAETRP